MLCDLQGVLYKQQNILTDPEVQATHGERTKDLFRGSFTFEMHVEGLEGKPRL